MSNAVVIIPVYKSNLNKFEKRSLKQCLKIFRNETVYILTHKHLNLNKYEKIFKKKNLFLKIEYFNKKNFQDTKSYNKLMLNSSLYKRFADFNYMLIYQLDSYVFKNDLQEWMSLGYNYVGAYLTHEALKNFENKHLSDFNSTAIYETYLNGGFSLRKITSTINLIENHSDEIYIYIKNGWNEDIIFSKLFKKYQPGDYPNKSIAIKFSFECNPSEMYILNNHELPMGCHAWYRGDREFYNNLFWYKHICPNYYYYLVLKRGILKKLKIIKYILHIR